MLFKFTLIATNINNIYNVHNFGNINIFSIKYNYYLKFDINI